MRKKLSAEEKKDSRFELRLNHDERDLALILTKRRGLPGVASLLRVLLQEEMDRRNGKTPPNDLEAAVVSISSLLKKVRETPADSSSRKNRPKSG